MRKHQEQVIAALLTSSSRREAAKAAGVSERTVYSYLQDPDVQRAYAQARQALVTDATGQIQRALGSAIAILTATVRDDTAQARERIAAARALLDYGIKYSISADISRRIEELEQANQ